MVLDEIPLAMKKGRMHSELPRTHVVLGKSRHEGVKKKKSKRTRNATMKHDCQMCVMCNVLKE